MHAKLVQQGLTVVGGTSAELKGYMKQEVPRWATLLKNANIKPE